MAGTDSQEVMEQRKTERSSSATNGINPTGPTLDVDCVHSSGFNSHYLTRYPDNPGASTTMTTADMIELDEFIILLNENMPCLEAE